MNYIKISSAVLLIIAILLACSKGSGSRDSNQDQEPSTDWPWDDIPLYTEAFNIEEYVEPSIRMKYEESEGRMFDTKTDFLTLHEFYLEKMSEHGWEAQNSMTPGNVLSIMKWESNDGKIYVEIIISIDPDNNARAMIARCQVN